VQERQVVGAQDVGDGGVALVPGRADGVEALVLVLELAGEQIEDAALELDLAQVQRAAQREVAAVAERRVEVGGRGCGGAARDGVEQVAFDGAGAGDDGHRGPRRFD
jgi:hypothetical protein